MIVLGAVSLENVVREAVAEVGFSCWAMHLIRSTWSRIFILPVLNRALSRWKPTLHHTHPVLTGIVMIVSATLLTSIAAILLHRWVERPMTQALRK